MIQNLLLTSVNLVLIEVFDALVTVELFSCIILVTHLTLNLNLWAFVFDMVIELHSCHVFKLR